MRIPRLPRPRFPRPEPIPRAAGVSRRAVTLGLGGRFTDELLSGLPEGLMPTLQRTLGLRYSQIGCWRSCWTTSPQWSNRRTGC